MSRAADEMQKAQFVVFIGCLERLQGATWIALENAPDQHARHALYVTLSGLTEIACAAIEVEENRTRSGSITNEHKTH